MVERAPRHRTEGRTGLTSGSVVVDTLREVGVQPVAHSACKIPGGRCVRECRRRVALSLLLYLIRRDLRLRITREQATRVHRILHAMALGRAVNDVRPRRFTRSSQSFSSEDPSRAALDMV